MSREGQQVARLGRGEMYLQEHGEVLVNAHGYVTGFSLGYGLYLNPTRFP